MGVFSSNDPSVDDNPSSLTHTELASSAVDDDPEATPYADAADADLDATTVAEDDLSNEAVDPTGASAGQMAAKEAANRLGDLDAINTEYNPLANAPVVPDAAAVRRFPDAYPESVVEELSRDPRDADDADDEYADDETDDEYDNATDTATVSSNG